MLWRLPLHCDFCTKNATTNWLDGVEDLSCLMGFGAQELVNYPSFWGGSNLAMQMSGDYEGFVLMIVHGLVPSLKLTGCL